MSRAANYLRVLDTTVQGFASITCQLCGMDYPLGNPHFCLTRYSPPSQLTPAGAFHKCPACDGWGKREKAKQLSNSSCSEFVDCTACDGRGIVWR